MSDRYSSEIAAAARAYPTVPPEWIWAVIGTESSFRDIYRTWEPTVKEYAYGPMQVLVSTAADFGFNEGDLQTAAGGIAAGTALLAQLISRFGYDFQRVYSAYNSGNPDKFTISDQVRKNVARAVDWLSQYVPAAPTLPEPAVAVPGLLIGALVVAGLYYLSTHTHAHPEAA